VIRQLELNPLPPSLAKRRGSEGDEFQLRSHPVVPLFRQKDGGQVGTEGR
jgi:hypothetical protein